MRGLDHFQQALLGRGPRRRRAQAKAKIELSRSHSWMMRSADVPEFAASRLKRLQFLVVQRAQDVQARAGFEVFRTHRASPATLH